MADAEFESLLIHSATIKRPQDAVGAAKRPVLTNPAEATGVACRIKPVKADNKQAIGGYVTDSDHKGYFLPEVDLRERDLVILASPASLAGTYEVRGVERPVDDTEVHHLTAHLKRKGVA